MVVTQSGSDASLPPFWAIGSRNEALTLAYRGAKFPDQSRQMVVVFTVANTKHYYRNITNRANTVPQIKTSLCLSVKAWTVH